METLLKKQKEILFHNPDYAGISKNSPKRI